MNQKRLAAAAMAAGVILICIVAVMIVPVKSMACEPGKANQKMHSTSHMPKETLPKDLTLETLYTKDMPALSDAARPAFPA